jgi:hypothetical protein
MERRHFIKTTGAIGLAAVLPANSYASRNSENQQIASGKDDRKFQAQLLYRMAKPVLRNLANGQLRKNMPVEVSPAGNPNSRYVSFLEGFCRLTAGTSLWLALPDDNTPESGQRKQLREWTLQGMVHAFDPSSPDYLEMKGQQGLVEAAFLTNGLIRNPKLWEPLDNETKRRFIGELKNLRQVKPYENNWVLFAAMTEIFLLSIGEEYNIERIETAINKIISWYIGDGWYSDGPAFHMDYYNSYVMQTMLVEILDIWVNRMKKMEQSVYETALKRMQRYSEFIERFISPEGAFPAFGRSIAYRTGVFQSLGLLAYMDKLPVQITPAQVRCGITAVMRRMFADKNNFDKDGFLRLGFVGYQPNITDGYSRTGSLYLASVGFLQLGLPASHEFWSAPPADWTAKKVWSGQEFSKDNPVNY